MSVLEKASELIDCLGQAGEPVSLAFVRSALDMPKSSTHRCSASWRALGSSGGPRMAATRSAPPPLLGRGRRRDVRPAIGRRAVDAPAAGRVGESVHLYVRDNDTRMCIAAVEARHELRPFIQLGRPLPLRAGAAGKLLLAFADDETQRLELRRARRAMRRASRTRRAPASREELERIRAERWATSVGERENGVAAAATPIVDSRARVVAALCISGPTTRLVPRAPQPPCASRSRRSAGRDQRAPPPRLTAARQSTAAPVELPEQLLLARPVLGDRAADPGHVHVVLEVDVLGRDVAAPRPAAEARRHRHPVVERPGVRLRLRLADHDPAHRSDRASRSTWSSSNE